MPIKNIDTSSIDTTLIDETSLYATLVDKIIYLYYIASIGSILFGALSGNKYGYHFVVLGVLVLGVLSWILVTDYCARIIVRYTENLEEREKWSVGRL